MLDLRLYLGKPLSSERFSAVARAIFGQDLSGFRVRADDSAELTKDELSKSKTISQFIGNDYLETRILTSEGDEIDHLETARLFATVGGVDAMVLDVKETSGKYEVDSEWYAISPWILFKPDGSMHRARAEPWDASEEEKPFYKRFYLLD